MSNEDNVSGPPRLSLPTSVLKTSRYRVLGEGSTTGLSILSIVVLLVLWWIATELVWVKPLFLPKPETIWLAFQQAMAGELDNHTLWVHFLWSMYRVFSAFILAVLIGIPVGIAMGVSRYARGIFDPPIEFYRPLPPLAYLPLMIIWFGIGEQAKIILLFLAIFAPVALAARAGVRSASLEQMQAALSMGQRVTKWCATSSCLARCRKFLWTCGLAWASAGPHSLRPRWLLPTLGSARWSTMPQTFYARTWSSSVSWRLAASPMCSS